MTSTLHVLTAAGDVSARPRPSVGRRVAVGAAAFLSCTLPATFAVSITYQLAAGIEADHRFHQVTGQGLLLCAFWLGGLLPLVRAGWRGVAPSVGASLQSVAVAGTALLVAAFAPGAGGLALAVLCAVSTALLWAALPVRPRLRGQIQGLDPVTAPVALLAASLLTPFIIGEIWHQNHTHDEHTDMAHYFDMAWVSLTMVVLGIVAALVPAARRRAFWTSGGLLLVGASRMAFTPDVTWSLLAMALGAVGTAALVVRNRR